MHTYINVDIHHTVLYSFPMVLTRRICLTIRASPVGDHSPHSRDLMFDSGVIVWEGGRGRGEGGGNEDAS